MYLIISESHQIHQDTEKCTLLIIILFVQPTSRIGRLRYFLLFLLTSIFVVKEGWSEYWIRLNRKEYRLVSMEPLEWDLFNLWTLFRICSGPNYFSAAVHEKCIYSWTNPYFIILYLKILFLIKNIFFIYSLLKQNYI